MRPRLFSEEVTLTSTIYNATVDLSDVDRSVYQSIAVRLPRDTLTQAVSHIAGTNNESRTTCRQNRTLTNREIQ